jgi:hypothetical protein
MAYLFDYDQTIYSRSARYSYIEYGPGESLGVGHHKLHKYCVVRDYLPVCPVCLRNFPKGRSVQIEVVSITRQVF